MPILPLLGVVSRPQADGGRRFVIQSEFQPAGDQPQAIAELSAGVLRGEGDQVLLGVTGSGKTFTMAHVIERTQRPALILAPNKTLAAQLYGEMKSFFPDNAVEYFVSLLRLLPARGLCAAHRHLYREGIARSTSRSTACAIRRRARSSSGATSIIVASVSCIYGIGSVETYSDDDAAR